MALFTGEVAEQVAKAYGAKTGAAAEEIDWKAEFCKYWPTISAGLKAGADSLPQPWPTIVKGAIAIIDGVQTVICK